MEDIGFYEALSPFYDEIFPASPEAVAFLANCVPAGVGGVDAPILDVACGTGSHALALAEKGWRVTGVDLDAAMIKRAREKGQSGTVRFVQGDMTSFRASAPCEAGYGLVYCIGNSLVHLRSLDEVQSFLSQAYGALAPGGKLMVQILNYDRIARNAETALPPIVVANGDVEFLRTYEFGADSKRLTFRGKLTVRGEARDRIGSVGDRSEVCFESSIALLMLREAELCRQVSAAGFSEIGRHGSFDGSEYHEADSFVLVLSARRPETAP